MCGAVPQPAQAEVAGGDLDNDGEVATRTNRHGDDATSIREHFSERTGKMEDVINRAAQVLSSVTHYTSLVMSPRGGELRIRNLQLVPVTATTALLVVVTDSGVVRDSVIHALVVSKHHIPDLAHNAELTDHELAACLRACAKVAQLLGLEESGYRVVNNCGKDACQTVKHLHFHIMGGQPMAERMA